MFGSLYLTFCMTDVHEQAPSTSWKFGSDLRIRVNAFEISLARAFSPMFGRLTLRIHVVRIQDGSLAMPGGIWVQLVGWWWRYDFTTERNRSPDAQMGSSGWAYPLFQSVVPIVA